MSIEEYSEELRYFINKNTKFINDESFQKKEELIQNPEIIEKYIEREMSFPEITCLFFYLSYFMEDNALRNKIIENINTKFIKQKIKAKEMPEYHYLIVYKESEEEYLNKNIIKIKQYFEDYLSKLKEALEYEELKRKLEEEAKYEEIREQEKRQRFILPIVNTCEIIDIDNNSITINVPLYDELEILNKNKYTIRNCIEKYRNTEIQYMVYIYNREKKKYDKNIISKKKENIDLNKSKYKIKIEKLIQN